MKTITLSQLNVVWNKVLKDPDAKRAFARLEQSGFRLKHLRPRDPSFHHPSWADYIAAIPFFPSDSRSTRRIHRRDALRKHRPLVIALRNFATQIRDPFCEVHIICSTKAEIRLSENPATLATTAANFIEKFLAWDWYARHRNSRNALIAELRCQIRVRTRKPHDRELSTLIDAALGAADQKELSLDNTALDRIERREKEARVKATRRLKHDAGIARTLKNGSLTSPRKPRKPQ